MRRRSGPGNVVASLDGPDSERPIAALDDQDDRDELRSRYYGLLQELRVVLPGVQVLVAFMLTVPFAQRFSDLDSAGRGLFGAALVTGILSVATFLTPTTLHRYGPRLARGVRLRLSIACTKIGLLLLALTMELALAVVARLLFDPLVVTLMLAVTAIAISGLWIVLPLVLRRVDEA